MADSQSMYTVMECRCTQTSLVLVKTTRLHTRKALSHSVLLHNQADSSVLSSPIVSLISAKESASFWRCLGSSL